MNQLLSKNKSYIFCKAYSNAFTHHDFRIYIVYKNIYKNTNIYALNSMYDVR